MNSRHTDFDTARPRVFYSANLSTHEAAADGAQFQLQVEVSRIGIPSTNFMIHCNDEAMYFLGYENFMVYERILTSQSSTLDSQEYLM